ncbi:hypothetical protein DAI22_03g192800 [Oryza sativa Japonica Group]|nr:hypothetical protein DAI22_03g192800 [Oryza sativa Japonica Group]
MSSIKYIQAGHPGAHLRRGRSRRINHHGAAPLPALDRCAPCCWGCSAPCPAMSDAPRRAATTTITSRPAGQLQSPGARHPTDVDPPPDDPTATRAAARRRRREISPPPPLKRSHPYSKSTRKYIANSSLFVVAEREGLLQPLGIPHRLFDHSMVNSS